MSSPVLQRHLSGLPYRALLSAGNEADPASRKKLLASLIGPSAYPNSDALLFTKLLA
jgi:hypothetical protein